MPRNYDFVQRVYKRTLPPTLEADEDDTSETEPLHTDDAPATTRLGLLAAAQTPRARTPSVDEQTLEDALAGTSEAQRRLLEPAMLARFSEPEAYEAFSEQALALERPINRSLQLTIDEQAAQRWYGTGARALNKHLRDHGGMAPAIEQAVDWFGRNQATGTALLHSQFQNIRASTFEVIRQPRATASRAVFGVVAGMLDQMFETRRAALVDVFRDVPAFHRFIQTEEAAFSPDNPDAVKVGDIVADPGYMSTSTSPGAVKYRYAPQAVDFYDPAAHPGVTPPTWADTRMNQNVEIDDEKEQTMLIIDNTEHTLPPLPLSQYKFARRTPRGRFWTPRHKASSGEVLLPRNQHYEVQAITPVVNVEPHRGDFRYVLLKPVESMPGTRVKSLLDGSVRVTPPAPSSGET